jgi:hypothetical protein
LWLWFAIYQQRRGAIEATMLRDAFLQLFDALAPGTDLGDQVRWLLDFQETSVREFAEYPPEKKAALDSAMGMEMPPEYYMAMYQLLAFPESPYRQGKADLPASQQRALSVCLLNAKMVAKEFFEPVGGEFVVRRRPGARTGPGSAAANRSDPARRERG